MNQQDNSFQKAFTVLKQDSNPTEIQKEKMLCHIMEECKEEDDSLLQKLKKIVYVYPWRCAFALSALQTLVLTLIFGAKYTDFFLGLIGG
ncbi:MAG TPA: hypothetical protein VJY54_05835 [Lachnospiraceae bacterium]|nr:hypothetical protein [Lachnospiraceae bacterium]